MSDSPIGAMKAVARVSNELEGNYAFLGGAVVNLLLDDPALSEVRPTKDVDVVIEVLSHVDYTKLEERLRGLGFSHDDQEGAPSCRWILNELTVDIMPTHGGLQGLNTAWFPEALKSAQLIEAEGAKLKIVSPVGFLATKYVAFQDRGEGDFYSSIDMEDFVTVIDSRAHIVLEIENAETDLGQYVTGAVRTLLQNEDFQDALSGYLPSDEASQARLPELREKLSHMAD